jgi:hypothetical protein
VIKAAEISSDEIYRYALWRRWDELDVMAGRVCWVMLNPSTADAENDDPTIRRCVDFSRRWGFGGLVVVNLFAYRATNPAQLREPVCDPVGPDNNEWVLNEVRSATLAVAAWGSAAIAGERARWVERAAGKQLYCLGTTASGSPRHPLYVPKAQALVPFQVSNRSSQSREGAGTV